MIVFSCNLPFVNSVLGNMHVDESSVGSLLLRCCRFLPLLPFLLLLLLVLVLLVLVLLVLLLLVLVLLLLMLLL